MKAPTPTALADPLSVGEAPTLAAGFAQVRLPRTGLEPMTFEARYRQRELIGEGGMGTVVLLDDAQIGRHVAMKVMRRDATGADAQLRFLREARVQGQLEHPAIVPVYDLGRTPEGTAYFIMKRIKGVTLETIVGRLRSGAADGLSRRRLLGAFGQVCLAVQFAHEHGVVHRDLKPGNLMLGDFGEVSVLDWGLAKVTGHADLEPQELALLDTEDDTRTRPGSVMGTPGYMAPEQLRGDPDHMGPPADVYALGAILFELLTLQPLHARGGFEAVASSTLRGADARPSVRAPEADVPQELEDLCVRATALDPAVRMTPRELFDGIERYLDGEQNEARRREIAAQHAEAARAAAERAVEGEGRTADRQVALRELGRALALDPSNADALDTMVRLLTEPPREAPPEIEAQIEDAIATQMRHIGRFGAWAYLSLLVYLPFFVWLGIRNPVPVVGFFGLVLVCSLLAYRASVSGRPTRALAVMVVSNLAFGFTSAFMGPLWFTPLLVGVNTTAYAVYLDRRFRLLAIASGCLTVLVPIVLEALGVLGPSYRFGADGLLVLPRTFDLPAGPTTIFLSVVALGTVLISTIASSRLGDVLGSTQRSLYLYTWHIRQFLPDLAKAGARPTG